MPTGVANIGKILCAVQNLMFFTESFGESLNQTCRQKYKELALYMFLNILSSQLASMLAVTLLAIAVH